MQKGDTIRSRNLPTGGGTLTRSRAVVKAAVRAPEFGILVFLIISVAFIASERSTFLTQYNVLNMGRQMSQLTIIGVAVTFLITSQELDLSVGSTFGLCSMTMAYLAQHHGIDLWLGFVVALALGASIGFVNGVITTYGRIPSFITTLGMLSILRGLTLMISPWPIARLEHRTFFEVFAGKIYGIPVQIFWMLGVVILGTLVYQRTVFGYYVRATGSNRSAAELSGIKVRRVKITAFMLTSMAAAFAGALSFAHLNSVAPTAGGGLELNVIAAVVIGGTALFGGQGTVIGTFLGAGLLIVMRNGLVQLGGDGRMQEAFLGGIIIVAVLVHTYLIGRRR